MTPELTTRPAVHPAGLNNWLRRIRAEYREMPGMHLTRPQIQRLWQLDPQTCDAVLAALLEEHVLRRTPGGAYALDDD